MPDALDRSAALEELAELVTPPFGVRGEVAHKGDRALLILRSHGLTWRDLLPIGDGERLGWRKPETLHDRIRGTVERLDLISPFDLARRAVLVAKPTTSASPYDITLPPLAPGEDIRTHIEIAGRLHDQVDEETHERRIQMDLQVARLASMKAAEEAIRTNSHYPVLPLKG